MIQHTPLPMVFLALVTLTGSLLFATSCQDDPGRVRPKPQQQAQPAHSGPPPGDPAVFPVEHLKGGALIFEDKFDDKVVAGHWVPPNKKASINAGWLRIAKNRNEPPLWLNVKLPKKVRIEFDVRSRSNDGDIKVELFGDGQTHQSGYVLVHGAHKNVEDWFARLDEHGTDRIVRPSKGAKRDQVYHWALVRTDNRVRWYIDGKAFLMYNDPKPLTGDGHAFFAVNTWDVPLEFDNIKVFDLEGVKP